MRVLRLFPAIAAVIALLCTSSSASAQIYTSDLNLELLWSQARRQPEDFAVACVPLYNPIESVIYNGDEPFPLASVGKLVTYVEYARQVDAGRISLGEVVSTPVLDLYALPRTDGGAHQRYMASFEEEVRSLSLWEVASEGMMGYSSNAASDYLLARLESVNWNAFYTDLNMHQTTPPHPLNMVPVMMSNHETGRLELDDVQSPTLQADGEAFFLRYIQDEQWRADEIEYRNQRRRGFPEWEVQQYILQNHTMTGTVRDFVFLMSAIYDDNGPLTENVKQLTRDALLWTDFENIDLTYEEYGSKLGFYSGGTLTLVAYGDPYNSDPVISVVFFRNIPRWNYWDMLRDDQLGDFAHWMNLNTCAGLRERLDAL
ncbi:MAG: serine hydrolase [Chloroflexota bacterium]